jgi:restriction system protein
MTVPTYDNFIEPLLRYLEAHPSGVEAKAAHEAAATALNLSAEDREQLLPSGTQRIYKNRAGWAHDRLKRAGLSSSPKRGFWNLTPEGIAFAKEHPAPLSPELIEKLAVDFMGVKLKSESGAQRVTPGGAAVLPSTPSPPAVTSPDDRLGQAIAELRQAAVTELLETLAQVSPTFFETIVLDLLHKMGYGARRADLQRVGGTGDAGIDGIISLDRLGLEKVYVQAKRWQAAVGRPDLQAFYGALAGQKAKRGVFITTSAYTAQALDFAKSVEGMVLIDGARLAELMIDCEVGVAARTVKIPKVDSDYFDEEGI